MIIYDHNLPHFSSSEALQLTQQNDLGIPFIIVSHAIGDEEAVALMRAGAADYLLKGVGWGDWESPSVMLWSSGDCAKSVRLPETRSCRSTRSWSFASPRERLSSRSPTMRWRWNWANANTPRMRSAG